MTRFVNKLMSPSLRGDAWDNISGQLFDVGMSGIVSLHTRGRNIDHGKVEMLCDSIKKVGLVQAIGVRYLTDKEQKARTDGGKIALLYGAHRLEAHRRLYEAAEKTGDKAEMDRWDVIPAVVYPETMKPDWGELLEITENLIRYELNGKQRAEQTTRLAAVYKELGLVQGAAGKSGKQRSKPNEIEPSHSVLSLSDASTPAPPLPTATEKLSKDLGISDDQVRNRVGAVGKATGKKGLSAEKSTAQELKAAANEMAAINLRADAEAAAKKAEKAAAPKAKAQAEPKGEKTKFTKQAQPQAPPPLKLEPSLSGWQKNMQARWFSAPSAAEQRWFLEWAPANMVG